MKLLPVALILAGVCLPVLAADPGIAALEEVNTAYSALSHKDNARAISLAKKALAVLDASPAKPAELSQADWDRRKGLAIVMAHFVAGLGEAGKNDFFAADKDLRAALPGLHDDKERDAAALFNLGLVNYQIGRQTYNKQRIMQAAQFSEDCAKIPGQFQVQAYNNAKAMRQEARTMP